MSKAAKNAIVIVIDGLQAGMLGCYGNTWIKTPEIDRLAAESFVFDQAIVDTLIPNWLISERSGSHMLCFRPDFKADALHIDLENVLSAQGIGRHLITDDRGVKANMRHSLNVSVSFLPPRDEARTADSWDQTQLAGLFASAADWLSEAKEPFCLWVQSQGLNGVWDAPYELRQQYADLEDPAPPMLVAPPNYELSEHYDPDQALGVQQAYAGQVSLIDLCLGFFMDAFREGSFAEDTLLVLLGHRGFGLGEHRLMGSDVSNAYNEFINVPWFVRSPKGAGKTVRSNALIQPADLYATLLEWFEIPDGRPACGGRSLWPLIGGEAISIRDRAGTFVNAQEWSLRTEQWHMRASGGDESKLEPPKRELYVKPDDRFEVNDVSSRCPEVVAALEEAWRDLVAVAESGKWDELPPLPEAATHGVD